MNNLFFLVRSFENIGIRQRMVDAFVIEGKDMDEAVDNAWPSATFRMSGVDFIEVSKVNASPFGYGVNCVRMCADAYDGVSKQKDDAGGTF